MSLVKRIKNQVIKAFWGNDMVPAGLVELNQYFRNNGPIEFTHKNEGGLIIAVSSNFRYGSIVTSGKDENELDKNIRDAILTSFEIPSSYAKEASIVRQGEHLKEYALA